LLKAQLSTFTKVYYDIFGAAQGYSLVKSFDQHYIIAGERDRRGLVMKVDSTGAVIWQKKLGAYDGMRMNCMVATPDSCVLAAGSIFDTLNGGSDLICIKMNAAGDTLWTQTVDFTTAAMPLDIKQTGDHGYIITGSISQTVAPYDEIFIVRLDASGNVPWAYTFSNGYATRGYAVSQTNDGGYIMAGMAQNAAFESYAFLMKLTASGTVTWTKKYTASASVSLSGYDVIEQPDGYMFLIGAPGSGLFLLKTDLSGNKTWCKSYDLFSPDLFNYIPSPKLRATHDGGYILSVHGWGFDPCIKIDSAGNYEWGKSLALLASDVLETSDKGFIILGNGPIMGVKLAPTDRPQIGLIKADSLLSNVDCILQAMFSSNPGNLNVAPITFSTTSVQLVAISSPGSMNAGLSTFDGCVAVTGKIPEQKPGWFSFTITPNPSDGPIRLIFNRDEFPSNANITIKNFLGEQVFASDFADSGSVQIDLGNRPDGLYFIQVRNGSNYQVQKLLLKHN
jgi:hypothetical protein